MCWRWCICVLFLLDWFYCLFLFFYVRWVIRLYGVEVWVTSARVPFIFLYVISFLTRLGVPCLSWCIFWGIYTLWNGLGTLNSEISTLGSICHMVLEWGRYYPGCVGLYDPLMFLCRVAEFMQLRWICGCLVLGWCIISEFLCCITEYFYQCFECLCVTDRMVCLLVLQYSYCLNELFRYSRGCIPWCFNGYTTVLWVQLVLAGDTVPTGGRSLEF